MSSNTPDVTGRVAPTVIPPDSSEAITGRPKVPASLYTKLADWQTRLLKILPGVQEDDLHFDLLVVDLVHTEGVAIHGTVETVSYEALSYSWGYAEATKTIICNGRPCQVSPALSDALRGMRLLSTPRFVWVDAFAINQTDTEEKSLQVQKMGLIFRKATNVLVWLGDTQMTFKIASVVAEIQRFLAGGDDAQQHTRPPEYLQRELNVLLQSSPWFKRTWVRQEVFYARRLLFIPKEAGLDWDSMTKCCAYMLENFTFPRGLGKVLQDKETDDALGAQLFMAENALRRPLMRWMTRFRLRLMIKSCLAFEATDPRDKVYGIVGMFQNRPGENLQYKQENSPPPLVVDYGRSRAQVYADMTLNMIQQAGHLGVLELHKPDSTLPSWAFNWGRPDGLTVEQMYTELEYSFPRDQTDYGRRHQGYMLSGFELADNKIALEDICEYYEVQVSEQDPATPILKLFGRWVGSIKALSPKSTFMSKFKMSRAPAREDLHPHWVPGIVEPRESVVKYHPFFEKSWREAMRHLLYVSYSPMGAREGDAIVCLRGGIVPFVVRQSQSLKGQYYTFVGPVLLRQAPDGWQVQPDAAEKLSRPQRTDLVGFDPHNLKPEDPPLEEFHLI